MRPRAVLCRLTFPGLGLDGPGRLAGLAGSGLVDGLDAELVRLSLLQVRHAASAVGA